MKTPLLRILFVLIAAAAAVFSLQQGDTWYLRLIAAAVFVLVAFLRQGSDDTRILLLASGEILVIAVAAASFWTGFVVQCAVIGAVPDGRKGSGRLPGSDTVCHLLHRCPCGCHHP